MICVHLSGNPGLDPPLEEYYQSTLKARIAVQTQDMLASQLPGGTEQPQKANSAADVINSKMVKEGQNRHQANPLI